MRYVTLDKNGVYRVIGHPRMMIDGIIAAFRKGDSPESIQTQWPFLTLEEISGCISDYLANQKEIDEYMARQHALWETLRAEQDRSHAPLLEKLREAKRTRSQSQA